MSDGRDKDIVKEFEDFYQEIFFDVVDVLNKRILDFLVKHKDFKGEYDGFISNLSHLVEQVCLNSFLYSCSSIYLTGLDNRKNDSGEREDNYLSFLYLVKESAKDSIDRMFSGIQEYVNKNGIDGDIGLGLKEEGENE